MTRTPRPIVVSHLCSPRSPLHQQETTRFLARWLAGVRGLEYGGDYDPNVHGGQPTYLVPSHTLKGLEQARALQVGGPRDLFGGYVEQPFMASKVITHPLVADGAAQPPGWVQALPERIRDSVLPGYSVFARADAETAAQRLLTEGVVRIKAARASGGREQWRVTSQEAFADWLGEPDCDAMLEGGVVVELDLAECQTFSVGQVQVDEHLLSYFGTQHETLDHQGQSVYGGSDLVVVRGDYAELLRLDLAAPVRLAIEQARRFDAAADALLTGFYASRRNYDTVQGRDSRGNRRAGVLEQSWRLGGASSAEIAALQAFIDNPRLNAVRACSFERFEDKPLPANATVVFRGTDDELGFLLKYAMVEPYDGQL